MGLKRKPTMDYNPQGNSIIERKPQVLGNRQRSFQLEEQDLNNEEKLSSHLSQLVLMQVGVRIT